MRSFFFLFVENGPMFLELHEQKKGMTWHSGNESTLAFLCSRSVKIIDFFCFTLLFLNNNKLKNVTFFLNNYTVDMTCGKKRIKN
jgi:hypothetical protein